MEDISACGILGLDPRHELINRQRSTIRDVKALKQLLGGIQAHTNALQLICEFTDRKLVSLSLSPCTSS